MTTIKILLNNGKKITTIQEAIDYLDERVKIIKQEIVDILTEMSTNENPQRAKTLEINHSKYTEAAYELSVLRNKMSE